VQNGLFRLLVPFTRQGHEPGERQPQAALPTHFSLLHGRLLHAVDEVQLIESYPRLFWEAEKFRIVRSEIDKAKITEREFEARKDRKDSVLMRSFTEVDELFRIAAAVVTGRKLSGFKFCEANWTVCLLHRCHA
jgi:hypothetical protein